jgi:nitrogen fixation NifU-like protein
MAIEELDDLYRDVILDHCRNPRNRPRLEAPDIEARAVNPFCGDEIDLQIRLDERGRVARVGLQSAGCSINQASGSLLSEAIAGKTLAELEALSATFTAMMRGPADGETPETLGDLKAMSGVRKFPVRVKCALLAWSALNEGIEEYRRGH